MLAFAFTAIVFLLGTGHGRPPIATPASMIEINRCEGYTQVIAWEWSPDWKRQHVMAWRCVGELEQLPARDAAGMVRVRINGEWFRSKWLRETYGRDTEHVNLKLFDRCYRWQAEGAMVLWAS